MTERWRYGDNGSVGDRAPSVFVIPNSNRLHIRVSTHADKNHGVDSDHVFHVGKSYKVSILVDSDRVALAVDDKVVTARILGQIYPIKDVVAFVSDHHYHPTNAYIRNLVFKNN